MLENLEPKKVFKYFEEISMIPRGSGNTEGMTKYLANFSKEHNLPCFIDDNNNVIIKKKGNEKKDTIIIQGHTDMVCVKTPDCDKDFIKDHIDIEIDGEWLKAKKTSLGGDDGIAVAMALAILDEDDKDYPSIECLFTADEETGMYGAIGLDGSKLDGKKMINIDSEDEGIFTVSCAGGAHIENTIKGKKERIKGVGYRLRLHNLLGGHSGQSIHRNHINANIEMNRCIKMALDKNFDIRLSSINGGQFDNVICPECICDIVLVDDTKNEFNEYIKDYEALLKNEYYSSDRNVTIDIEKCEIETAFTKEDTKRIVEMIYVLPNGLIEMSQDFNDLPLTSLNMGVLKTEDDIIKMIQLVRSAIDSRKEYIVDIIKSILYSYGEKSVIKGSYPAWQYKNESQLREKLVNTFKKVYGKNPKIEATHGGLECGLFMDKIKGLDAISIGPTIIDVHSVNEKLNIKSVERTYNFLQEFLSS